jgi:hypothetical protein
VRSTPELESLPLPGGHCRPAERFRSLTDTVGSRSWVTEGDTAGSLIASREPYKSKMTLDFAAGDAV